jgi:hypothetical protein
VREHQCRTTADAVPAVVEADSDVARTGLEPASPLPRSYGRSQRTPPWTLEAMLRATRDSARTSPSRPSATTSRFSAGPASLRVAARYLGLLPPRRRGVPRTRRRARDSGPPAETSRATGSSWRRLNGLPATLPHPTATLALELRHHAPTARRISTTRRAPNRATAIQGSSSRKPSGASTQKNRPDSRMPSLDRAVTDRKHVVSPARAHAREVSLCRRAAQLTLYSIPRSIGQPQATTRCATHPVRRPGRIAFR